MGQHFFTYSGPDDLFLVLNPGTIIASAALQDAMTLAWDGGAPDPAIPAGTQPTYNGAATFDATRDLYLVVAQPGSASLSLVRAGIVALDAAFPSGWGILGWIDQRRFNLWPPISAAVAGALPTQNGTAQRGDVWFYDGTAWQLRHIGNPGDLLTDVGGLPVWQPLTLNGVPITPTPTTIQTSDDGVHGAKAIVITPGSPPAGWQNVGFDHSSWPLAIQSNQSSGFIIAATHEGANGQVLFWVPFPLLASQLTNLSLIIQDDSQYNAIYINGQFLAGPSALIPNAMPPTTIPIPGSMIVTGQNYLAVWSINDADVGVSPAFGGIRYTIQTSQSQIPASALPPGTGNTTWAHNDAAVGVETTGSFNDSPSVAVTATHGAGKVDYSFATGGVGTITFPTSTTPVLATTTGLAVTAKAFNVSGAPPANWDQPGFADGGWPGAVDSTQGADYIVSQTPEGPNGIVLFRDHFTVANLGGTDHATIQVKADAVILAISVNGNALSPIAIAVGSYATYTVPNGQLVAGSNLLAIECRNDNDAFGGVGYSVSTGTTSIPQGLTFPSGVEGNLLTFHSGAWVVVPPPASSGLHLTSVLGGIPTWS